MPNTIEAVIERYSASRSDDALRGLDAALVQDSFLIPVSREVARTRIGSYDIPVICMKTKAGDGAIPAFTTIDQLLNWKPEGCKYVTLTGKALLEMALGMAAISQIVINVDGTPRGAIPRSEFKRLLTPS